MRVPYSWLKELLPETPEPEELAHVLTMGGLEVEEIQAWRSEDGAAEDLVLVTKVTANRGDLLSMVGVARQAAALLGLQWRPPIYVLPETEEPIAGTPQVSFKDVTVEIQTSDACPRYSALLVDGVQVMPSPDWLQHRLLAAGVRTINNVVDCTNYVTWEVGQPLHAFDCRLITDRHVIVRMAAPNERLVTIDGQERVLGPEDLVIADPEQAIALAGVMGGVNTEMNDATTRVLLESAHFDATTIRRTSLRLGLSTEASYRFERFVDPNLTLPALARAAELILQTAWGEIEGPALDVKMREFEPRLVDLRPSRCRALLGADIDEATMTNCLERLGMQVQACEGEAGGERRLRVLVPTFRADVEREVDLIEEVAIVQGYESIPMTIPGKLTRSGRLTPRQRLERRVREVMRECGLSEMISFSQMDPADLDRLGLPEDAPERRALRLANPMTTDASLMRTTLLPAMLGACTANQNQGVEDVTLFEINPVYVPTDNAELPEEPKHVAGVLMGSPYTAEWNVPETSLDFFWVKGIVEQLGAVLGLEFAWRRAMHPTFHPGQCAEVLLGDEVLGLVGQVAPVVAEAFDLRRDVFAFELNLEPILAAAGRHTQHVSWPHFPAARRDIAVVVPDDDAHSAAALEALIRGAAGQYLERIAVFDVFTDATRFGPGRRSIAFHVAWRAPDRTMTDEEVDELMAAVIEALKQAGAELRV